MSEKIIDVHVCRGQTTKKTRARKSTLGIFSSQPKRQRRHTSVTTTTTVQVASPVVGNQTNVDDRRSSDVVGSTLEVVAVDMVTPVHRRPRQRSLSPNKSVAATVATASAAGNQPPAFGSNVPVPDGTVTSKRGRGRQRSLSPNTSVSAIVATATAAGDQPPAFGSSSATVPDGTVPSKRVRRRRALTADTQSPESVGAVSTYRPQTADNTETAVSSRLSDFDDELPSFSHVTSSFTVGDLIWVKHRKYPYWPALVSYSCIRIFRGYDDK